MAQLHLIHHGIDAVRPTNDVDIVLHIETRRGVPAATAAALEGLGYRLVVSIDPREHTAHRFARDGAHIDVVTSATPSGSGDSVDVVIADHPAPRVQEALRGRTMVQIEGGTQALRRTLNARLEFTPGVVTTISVPNPFGAVILKAVAYQCDSRDRDRHLYDAAALLACVEDPLAERAGLRGSDRARLALLERNLPDEHPAWLPLPPRARRQGQGALRLLLLSDTL